MTIKLNDKEVLKQLRGQITDALNGKIDGLEFDTAGATYSPDGSFVTFKLEVKIKGGESKALHDLRSIADLYGIDPDKQHPKYKLVGYSNKAVKFPFLIEIAGRTGTFKISTAQAKEYFGKASDGTVSLTEALAEGK